MSVPYTIVPCIHFPIMFDMWVLVLSVIWLGRFVFRFYETVYHTDTFTVLCSVSFCALHEFSSYVYPTRGDALYHTLAHLIRHYCQVYQTIRSTAMALLYNILHCWLILCSYFGNRYSSMEDNVTPFICTTVYILPRKYKDILHCQYNSCWLILFSNFVNWYDMYGIKERYILNHFW